MGWPVQRVHLVQRVQLDSGGPALEDCPALAATDTEHVPNPPGEETPRGMRAGGLDRLPFRHGASLDAGNVTTRPRMDEAGPSVVVTDDRREKPQSKTPAGERGRESAGHGVPTSTV